MLRNKLYVTQTSLYSIFAFIVVFAYTLFLQLFTEFHNLQQGDSLLLSIMSYTKPTLYYWGQDQYLNFLPFVFSIVRDPSMNLLLMSSFQLGMLLTFSFFTCKTLNIDDIIPFGVVSLLCLALFNGYFWFELCYQPYLASFILLLVSLGLIKKTRLTRAPKRFYYLILSALLALLAFKIAQPSIVLLFFWGIMPTYVLNAKEGNRLDTTIASSSSEWKRIDLLFSACFVLFLLLFALFDYWYLKTGNIPRRGMHLRLEPIVIWSTLKTMIHNMSQLYLAQPGYLFVLPAISLLMHTVLFVKGKYFAVRKSVMLFHLPALTIAILISSLEWVRMNLYNPRYLIFSIILMILGLSYVSIETFKLFNLRQRLKMSLVFLLILILLVVIPNRFHFSTYMTINDRILSRHEFIESVKIAKTMDGAIGNYWLVWPLVWSVNASENRDFLGVSYRSVNIMDIINNRLATMGKLRLISYKNDQDVEGMLTTLFYNKSIKRINSGQLVIIEISNETNAGRRFLYVTGVTDSLSNTLFDLQKTYL